MRRLFVDFARIGDLVMMIPAMRLLAADAELHVVSRPWAKDLLAGQPFVAGVHTLVHPNHGWWSELLRGKPREALGRQLAAIGFDEVVLIDGERAMITDWLRQHLPQARQRSFHHGPGKGYVAEEARLGLADAGFDISAYSPVPRLAVADAARAAATTKLQALGQRVLLIQAGSSLTHRRWRPRPNLKSLTTGQWAELIGEILGHGLADAVVLIGSKLEAEDAQRIADTVPSTHRHRVHVWAGLPIRELAAVSAAAQGMISVDTGPAHIAAAVGCPLLVLFGPTDPARWLPRGEAPVESVVGKAPCGPCLDTPRFKTCRANICLTNLPVESVVAGWRRVLARTERG